MLFALKILLAGVATIWLVGLIPAGALTTMKGNSRLLGWGCLSLGLPWFAGALYLAPPDTWWARRFYDADKRRRAELGLAAQRSPRALVTWALAAIALVIVVGFFVARPAPVLGIDGASLESSLPHSPFSSEPCHEGGGEWTCWVATREASGDSLPYRVHIHGLGCWTAKPAPAAGRGWRQLVGREGWGTLRGCVSLLDYL
jgi:hypothetical protein